MSTVSRHSATQLLPTPNPEDVAGFIDLYQCLYKRPFLRKRRMTSVVASCGLLPNWPQAEAASTEARGKWADPEKSHIVV